MEQEKARLEDQNAYLLDEIRSELVARAIHDRSARRTAARVLANPRNPV
jgi:hypothetical protein